MPSRSLLALAALGLWGSVATFTSACHNDPTCADNEVLDANHECVVVGDTDTDTEETDTTDTTPNTGAVASMRAEWDVAQLPNDNTVTVICEGREVASETDFVARKTYFVEWEQTAGNVCEIHIQDARGGAIPAGRLFNCSTEVGTWETFRSVNDEIVFSHTVFGCTLGCADPIATNYNPAANQDDGSCNYVFGCTDSRAFNFNPAATKDDGSCNFGGFGTVSFDILTNSYPADTTVALRCNGFEVIAEDSFRDANASYHFEALVDAGFDCEIVVSDEVGDEGPGGSVEVCGQTVATWAKTGQPGGVGGIFAPYEEVAASFFMTGCSGCTNPFSPEFDPTALVDDGTCTIP